MRFSERVIQQRQYRSKRFHLSPSQILLLGFMGLILAGAGLLTLPVATAQGESTGFFTALFTATSASCVTGLTMVDLSNTYSMMGQIVIVVLVQVGGLGVMTASTILYFVLGKRISLKNRLNLSEAFNQDSISGVVRLAKNALLFTFVLEATGTIILSVRLFPTYGSNAIWQGVFLSVCAFCNAGFDLLRGTDSLVALQNDPVILHTIAALIVLGGLGFFVLYDILHSRKIAKWSLHTKLVICTTLFLILTSALAFWLFENQNAQTMGAMNWTSKINNAYFQAVSLRTAGFASMNQGDLTPASLLLGIVLMLIGASPASTGGGMKTTTFALMVLMIHSVLKNKKDVEFLNRRIAEDLFRKATMVVTLFLSIFIFTAMLICAIENASGAPIGLDAACYETASAVGTVGFTLGATPQLHHISQFLLILCMYLGRLGPLTLLVGLQNKRDAISSIHLPEERVMIG